MQQIPSANDSDGPADAPAPRVHTLLLTDLCDSVALVERLGDTAAAELFQEHDRLVLRLQQHWKGRMIDRSDGLLLLFDRPINGLGFALDYRQGLEELARSRGVGLQARTGMHVGEVLTWHNSAEAVQAGAKPLEVEGLAKPLAARLMALARPGQILLSAVAESLTRRSVRELGGRSEHLLWKSHGRWHFKGVPITQEVFEVGEPGFAPLRMPRSTPKAWRDLPLWRRPVALVAELALLGALGIGAWFILRPEPAIAFAERDWVVMGDLRNLTGDAALDESMAQALRISLEQSRYLNVLSDMTTGDTLARMRRQRDTAIDRAIGSEIAIRDGARAVVLPTLAQVGGRLRVTVEVVDPQTQATIYVLTRDVRKMDDLLASIDSIAGSVRDHLGEPSDAIRNLSQPLPEVTTASLDALKLYASGKNVYNQRRMEDARVLYQKAVDIDPQFALALVGITLTYMSQGDADKAEPYLRRALVLRDHLPMRDRLYMEALAAEFEPQPSRHAPAKWRLLGEVYPDYAAAHQNYAWDQFTNGNLDEALTAVTAAAASKEPLRYVSWELKGRIQLAQEKYDAAIASFEQMERISGAPPNRHHASALAAQGKLPEALRVLEASAAREPSNALIHVQWVAALLAAGRAADAMQIADAGVAKAADDSIGTRLSQQLGALVARYHTGMRPAAELAALLEQAIRVAEAASAGELDGLAGNALAAARLQQRYVGRALGEVDEQRLARLAQRSGEPGNEALHAVVAADQWRLRGDPQRAMRQLRAAGKASALTQWHVAMRDGLQAAGDVQGSRQEQDWVSGHPGAAWGIRMGGEECLVMNVVEMLAADTASVGAASVVEGKNNGMRPLAGQAQH